MLGFILSKLNLLILVVAIFAIVAFFTFSLIDIVKVYEGRLLLDQLSSKVFSLVSSPSYCFSDSFDLPRSIIVGGEEFFYVIRISTQIVKVGEDKEEVTIVIFSMIPRKDYIKYKEGGEEPPSVAASAFRTKSEVKLFSREYLGQEDDYSASPSLEASNNFIIVDPSTRTPFHTIEFRKEIKGGEEKVYLFPCSSYSGNCEQIRVEVACAAFTENAGMPNCTSGDLQRDFEC